MSVPAPNHPCWQKLASGGLSRLNSQNLGAQLLAKRLERSQDPLSAKASEVHAFFAKWERVLGQELAQLAKV